MEVVAGPLPNLLPKLAELVAGEYHLQKRLKGEIRFLKEELESMKAALEDIFKVPADHLPNQDKIWARNVRDMSYDIEDSIDTFMVQCKGKRLAKQHGLKKVIDRSLNWLMQPKIRRKIATEIREIKSRVIEVHERRRRYEVNLGVDKPVTVDPRLFTQYKDVKELVGIDEARDELIHKIMTVEENEDPMNSGKIVSIVGFGGLGKTTLANVVYEKIRARFDCCAFVSVSQTPNLKKLYKGLLYDLGKNINEEILDERQLINGKNINEEILDERQLINILREFLQTKRYFIVIDDIWDISVWEMIRFALPNNDVGYTIITTTRISDVAEHAGDAYKLKPLSLNNSRKLLYGRIFGTENKDNNKDTEKCPDDELAEVSDRILKKCAGVPLAIITMASLLACKRKNKIDWYEVCNNIGTGLEDNPNVENMRKILSFSYYELPCHLRTCLLYLSMFPEDFEIYKDHLINMWIGEGFIRCKKQGKSLFEIGESYFNELINRSMILPIYDSDDLLYSCHVHDMMLDLLCSLSSEENFVTILNDMDRISQSSTIRRLSLQSSEKSHAIENATSSLPHARSVIVFRSAVAQVPALGSCRVLRVLDLNDCILSSQANSLKYLGNLYHLRYLGLHNTSISQLPEEIGNLQFLQTLDVRGNNINRVPLPSAVVQLRNLMFLYIGETTIVPNGIGNLTCLQQLSCLSIGYSTIDIIEELGQLTELRRLHIKLDVWNDKLLECLRKLQKIQELEVFIYARRGQRNIGGLDAWAVPRHLRVLLIEHSCWFSTLPPRVNPSLLLDLQCLSISVRELHQVDLEVLGKLPALRSLILGLDIKSLGILRGLVVGAGSFPCLEFCSFQEFAWPVVFQEGAMPRLRRLVFRSLYVQEAGEIASSDGDLDMGLGNLPSLQHVIVGLLSEGASREVAEHANAALTHAAERHPNHPDHDIYCIHIDLDSASWTDTDEDDDHHSM